MMSAEELRELCKLTFELTRLRQNEYKHLAIDSFAPQLLGKLIRERHEIDFPQTRSEHLPSILRYRNIDSGIIHELICNATLASDMMASDKLMVVYRNTETGERWVRPADEFGDGRFERIE